MFATSTSLVNAGFDEDEYTILHFIWQVTKCDSIK